MSDWLQVSWKPNNANHALGYIQGHLILTAGGETHSYGVDLAGLAELEQVIDAAIRAYANRGDVMKRKAAP